jgi:hypothetical protein
VKESFTAAIVVRSLWAALGEVWVVGLLEGWVVVRLAVCWPVACDVVVAVDIGTCDLLEGWMERPAAKTGGGEGWEKSLAGDGFEGLRRAISHRGDRGAVCHHAPDSGRENPGRTPTDRAAGFCRDEDGAARGTPYTYRRKKRKK